MLRTGCPDSTRLPHGRYTALDGGRLLEAGAYEMLFQLVGESDFIVTYGKRHARGKDIAVFDICRLADSLFVEHWSNPEEIAPRETWGNTGKF